MLIFSQIKEEFIMYGLAKRILDRAKSDGVDIGIAYDYIANEIGYTDGLKIAFKFIQDNYEAVTALRVKGKETELKTLARMWEKDNIEGVKNYIEYLKSEGVI